MRIPILVLALLASTAARAADFPEFPDADLKQGRAVWLGTCQACHANPMGDAPQVKDKAAWTARVAKGREALYRSALGGFTGPSGTEMPPRGGNASLGDTDVRRAVDYMLKLV